MMARPRSAAIYSNGTTPLFLDTAEVAFAFEDGPPVTSRIQIARIDHRKNTAIIVFDESDEEAIQALSLGRHFHRTVSLDKLRMPERAEETNPEFAISHTMQVTLHALSGDRREFDPLTSSIEALVANAMNERRQMLRAESAIRDFQRVPSPATQRTMLKKLSAFKDAEALSLLEGNKQPGAAAAVAAIQDVKAMRKQMRAVAEITRQHKKNRRRFPVNAIDPRYADGRRAKALDVVVRRSGTRGRPFLGQIASIDREGIAAVAFMSRKAAMARRATCFAYQTLSAAKIARRFPLSELQLRHRSKRPLARPLKSEEMPNPV